jgi:hypothetical protein
VRAQTTAATINERGRSSKRQIVGQRFEVLNNVPGPPVPGPRKDAVWALDQAQSAGAKGFALATTKQRGEQ